MNQIKQRKTNMKKILLALAITLATTSSAIAGFDMGDVKKLKEKIKKGESFVDYNTVEGPQIWSFKKVNAGTASYTIDFKTRNCYFTFGFLETPTTLPIDCSDVKKVNPELNALIDWTK